MAKGKRKQRLKREAQGNKPTGSKPAAASERELIWGKGGGREAIINIKTPAEVAALGGSESRGQSKAPAGVPALDLEEFDEKPKPKPKPKLKQKNIPKALAAIDVTKVHCIIPKGADKLAVQFAFDEYEPKKFETFKFKNKPGQYAIVTFANPEIAQKAIDGLNGTEPDDVAGELQVTMLRSRTENKKRRRQASADAKAEAEKKKKKKLADADEDELVFEKLK